MTPSRIDFAHVNAAAMSGLEGHLCRWLPGGRFEGHEYVCAGLAGGHGRSCSTNLKTCVGGDFSGELRWNDPVSLYAATHNLKMGEAARQLASELGISPDGYSTATRPQSQVRESRQPSGRIVATYDYLDAAGNLVFQVVRKDPKDFRQRKPDGRGGWEWTIKGVELVPYRLPDVINAQALFIVEGERDADALAAIGLTATTCAQGAGKWRPGYNPHFADKNVCILPDNDDPGRMHAQAVAQHLHGTARAIKIVELPGLPPKGDVSDWLNAGGTREALLDLVKAAPSWSPQNAIAGEQGSPGVESARGFRFLPLGELLAAPRPTRWLIRGYLEAETLSVLFGEAGSMKSFLAIDMALCISTGTPWHGQAIPNPGPTFYVCGEGFHGLSRRVKAWVIAHGVDPSAIPFFTSNSPAQLLDATHAREVADAVASLVEQYGPPRLVVIDTLARSFVGGDENSSMDMGTFIGSLDALKARFGCAVMVIHHSGLQDKGRSRGSSVLRAAIDFEFRLTVKGDARVLACTKIKDFEMPHDLAFEPETVELEGWVDFETLEPMTSCVLRQTTLPEDDKSVRLTGPQQIALNALRDACEAAGGSAHVNEWRKRAYELGISSGEVSARMKAFKRAKDDLTECDLVRLEGALWCLTQNGQSGHEADMSTLSGGHTSGQSGHTSLDVSACPSACPLPEGEGENPFGEVSNG